MYIYYTARPAVDNRTCRRSGCAGRNAVAGRFGGQAAQAVGWRLQAVGSWLASMDQPPPRIGQPNRQTLHLDATPRGGLRASWARKPTMGCRPRPFLCGSDGLWTLRRRPSPQAVKPRATRLRRLTCSGSVVAGIFQHQAGPGGS